MIMKKFFQIIVFEKTINDILDESINTNWLFILTGAIGMGHFKSLCCIPYFLIVIFIIICIVVGTILLVIFGVTNIQQEKNTPVFVTLVTITVIVGIAIVGNLYTWGKMMLSLVRSTRKRIMKAADQLVLKKMEGFMQTLKSEVELLTRMTQHLDSFTGNLTRLVVIVDGLDSCEQEKLLQVSTYKVVSL